MPTRTGASYGTDTGETPETNWAAEAAAAAAATVDLAAPDFECDEEEEWVDTGANDEEDENENLVTGHEKLQTNQRPTWILNVAIPNSATNDTGEDSLRSANIFIDPGMTSERLGRCIVQAVSSSSVNYSESNNDYGLIDHRSSLVGLFGKEDRVFYSLEFILAMDPADGARRIFSVTKPTQPTIKITKGVDGYSRSIFSFLSTSNMLNFILVLFMY